MNDIKIEKGIPIPDGRKKWPVGNMKVGDSFVADESSRGSLYALGKKHGYKFTIRKINGSQIRIWRVK